MLTRFCLAAVFVATMALPSHAAIDVAFDTTYTDPSSTDPFHTFNEFTVTGVFQGSFPGATAELSLGSNNGFAVNAAGLGGGLDLGVNDHEVIGFDSNFLFTTPGGEFNFVRFLSFSIRPFSEELTVPFNVNIDTGTGNRVVEASKFIGSGNVHRHFFGSSELFDSFQIFSAGSDPGFSITQVKVELARSSGAGPGPSSAVPEPSSIVFFALGCIGLPLRSLHRRRQLRGRIKGRT